ncbi:MAG TPA: class I SAM-dependent methyltransferase [Caldimonas sp.]|jgi:SAM-dependent methyltransferase|nr:class I SAM-dependent methyltransferase [Caldimonas sp.]HEX2542208.1 class I SAM-dependent methyltransferase [Caldimonas sp.]
MSAVPDLDRFIQAHGDWTAMSIRLPDGRYTRAPAVDHRLRRLVQVAADVIGKPLRDCRVLDLACLEGHYAIEFALHGADVVGIEGRQVSVDKCNYVRDAYDLDRLRFVCDDVRNLSAQKYGIFDIVICSGLLYHLPARDAWGLVRAMHECCSGITLIDTFVSLHGTEEVDLEGMTALGHTYGEHDVDEAAETKAAKLWASIDNVSSFWFTEPSLINLLARAGFTSTMAVLAPTMPGMLVDRRTYVTVKGRRSEIKSSELTDRQAHVPAEEGENRRMDDSQHTHGRLHLAARQVLPQPVKDAIKPLLRWAGVLPQDTTPEFMSRKGGGRSR